MLAYVCVKCEPNIDSGVAQEIMRIPGIRDASWTYGFCDILFKINVRSVDELDRIVFKKIRKISGVSSTETLIVSPIPIYSSRPSRLIKKKKIKIEKKRSKSSRR